MEFCREYIVRWSDLDGNKHMKNIAYMEYAMQTRFHIWDELGFTVKDFDHHHIGPIAFREESLYFRELHIHEHFSVNFSVGGLSDDFRKFTFRNDLFAHDGALSAIVRVEGAWLDMQRRKIIIPPPELIAVLQQIPHADDYTVIP